MRTEPLRSSRTRGFALLLVASALILAGSVPAQDTPEMLAAMRAAMPPVPATVPSWDELPADLRAQIPPIALGMHRWHEVREERFVLIGGRRINEGDVAGQQLWLREIRREGVVLQFRDAFFLLPR